MMWTEPLLKKLTLTTSIDDPHGDVTSRYLGDADGAIYLIRPDQHVVARWETTKASNIETAVRIAIGKRA